MKSFFRHERVVRLRLASTLTAVALLSSCGGGGSSATGAPGALRLALTDGPACGFDHVYVTIESVRVHASASAEESDAGWTDIPLAEKRRVDLLTLTNGALTELGTTALPAGRYQQVRLVLAANEAGASAMANAVLPTGSTEERPLGAPGGQGGSSIKIPAEIEVAADATADFVLDFDACKSVAAAGRDGTYQLKPVITVVPRSASGIEGVLADELAANTTIVSAQRDGISIRSTRPDASGRFSIPFLEPGSYSLVIASEAHATGVVTDVPVHAGMTIVGQPATAIALPRSPAREITGAVTLNTESDAGASAPSPFTEGLVRAAQQLAGGHSFEVRSRPLDAVAGTYRLTVPTAAPMRAAYAGSGALSFVPDATDAGRYSVDVLIAAE